MTIGTTAIVNYGLCNIDSITRILEELGANVDKTSDPRVIERADRIVLPGVGAFGAAMRNLADWRLDVAIRERIAAHSGVPFLGICLGMQLMATRSEEHGEHRGLDIVAGSVVRLKPSFDHERVPHVGWNEVIPTAAAELFQGVESGSDFYFVHSYHFQPADPLNEAATTPYCGGICAAVTVPDRPIYGTQFHPEKSQRNGQKLLRNFLRI